MQFYNSLVETWEEEVAILVQDVQKENFFEPLFSWLGYNFLHSYNFLFVRQSF